MNATNFNVSDKMVSPVVALGGSHAGLSKIIIFPSLVNPNRKVVSFNWN